MCNFLFEMHVLTCFCMFNGNLKKRLILWLEIGANERI